MIRRSLPILLSLAVPAWAQDASPSGASVDTTAGALVRAEASSLRAGCSGGDGRIEGNRNTVVLTGECRSLLLKGVGNTVSVSVRAGAAIRVEGSGNRVTFQAAAGPAPTVDVAGPDNLVMAGVLAPEPAAVAPPKPAAIAAPPPIRPVPPAALPAPVARSGPLALSGDDQSLATNCAGRDVGIDGNRSLYVLRGGCRTLVVRGDGSIVQAEMAPGGRITVSGRGSIVSYAIHPAGTLPAATVHGEGSRVQRISTIGGQPVR